ncbi:MAG: class I SAM-dependent methyltransferase [Acidimicrobiales bacterium]
MPSDPSLDTAIDFQRLYAYRFRGLDQAARQRVWDVIAPWIHDRMGRPARVLDPAAGRFEFLNAITAEERWGGDTVDHGHARDGSIRLVIGDALDVDLPTSHFDGIFISNFLEHLASQEHIARFLRRMLETSAPGGTIAVLGPNFRYCAPKYFDAADHVVALSHVSVAEHVHAAGFEVTEVIPKLLPYSFVGRLPPSPTLTRAYLRFRPAWWLLGRQFLVVGRRPG